MAAADRERRSKLPIPQEEPQHNMGYLKFHTSAKSAIIQELDDETREEYEQLVDEWNYKRVPEDVKRRQVPPIQITLLLLTENLGRRATEELGTVIKRFTDELEEQMGVKLFVLAGYRDLEGEVARTK